MVEPAEWLVALTPRADLAVFGNDRPIGHRPVPARCGPIGGRESAAGHDVGADANERFDPIGQIDEPEADRRGYLDQDVHVAVLPLVSPRVRAKESQPRDPELPGQTWPCLMEYAKNVMRALHGVIPPRKYTAGYHCPVTARRG